MSADGPQAASGAVYVGGPVPSDRKHEPVSRGVHGVVQAPQQPVPVHT